MTGPSPRLLLVQVNDVGVARQNQAHRERALLDAVLEAEDPAAVDAALRALYTWLEPGLSPVPPRGVPTG